jgi:YidC/Oxa1 family membrane protein insertase
LEGQGKRLFLAVALALGIVLLWNVIFPPEKPKPKPPVSADVEKPPTDSPVGRPTVAPEGGTTNVAPPTTQAEDKTIELAFPNFVATFSTKGARLTSWKLTEKKWERDWNKGEMLPDHARGAFGVNFVDSTIVLPHDAVWESSQPSPDVLVFTYRSTQLELTKTFKIYPDAYMLSMSVERRDEESRRR